MGRDLPQLDMSCKAALDLRVDIVKGIFADTTICYWPKRSVVPV